VSLARGSTSARALHASGWFPTVEVSLLTVAWLGAGLDALAIAWVARNTLCVTPGSRATYTVSAADKQLTIARAGRLEHICLEDVLEISQFSRLDAKVVRVHWSGAEAGFKAEWH
jgi:hypothetical protein